VLPDAAPRILTEPGWHTLAATLHDIATVGGDPEEALWVAACRRPPTTVPSVSGLLTWRIRKQSGLQQPATPHGRPDPGHRSDERRRSTAPGTRSHDGLRTTQQGPRR
jgi:hypothetical protein